MTDEQIIRALKCCAIDYCNDCPLANEDIEEIGCNVNICFTAYDLINRLKTENERLKKELEELREIVFTGRTEASKNLKSEAIKEFAERLKEIYRKDGSLNPLFENIDNLVKEMTEANKFTNKREESDERR